MLRFARLILFDFLSKIYIRNSLIFYLIVNFNNIYLKIKGNIWIETDTGLEINAVKALLLEQIDVLGSISEAAKVLNIPYRRAWGMIQEMNRNSSFEIVAKEAGGKAGGHSILTEEGRDILQLFKDVNDSLKQYSKGENGYFTGWKEN